MIKPIKTGDVRRIICKYSRAARQGGFEIEEHRFLTGRTSGFIRKMDSGAFSYCA
jgi:hypothetical protein